jgi:hypothetical protein
MAPLEVKATTMLSKAPELWSMAVIIQPEKTALVVSLMRSTIFSARATPIILADDLIRMMAEMKKYIETSDPMAFLSFSANF